MADLSGGGIYWYGGSKSKYNTVDGCIFTNNTAHGNTTDKSITRGGGAIYWSEGGSYGTVKNSEFYNNSVQSTIKWKVDGGAILWDKSYHALVDNCTFVGDFVTTDGDASGTGAASVWAQGGAMYLRPNGNYTVRNCHFENCSSSKEAGALYIQGLTSGSTRMLLLENSVFINNVAEANGQYNINGGGAIQVKQCTNVIFNNVTFINNTANKGGALCVYDSVTNFVVNGANFTENKANKGSAISASVYFKLNDAVLLDNRADTTTLDLTFDRENGGSIDILMEGADTHLNAMYVKHGNKGFTVSCNNVTYWTDNNITIGKTAVQSGTISSTNLSSVPEKGIGILVEIFDGDNNKLHEGIYATDADGRIHLNLADILTEQYSTDNIYVTARLPNEDYYTMMKATSRIQDYINASALDTIFHRNTTVTANITGPTGATLQSARGNVSVYIDDVFKGNMTIENGKGSLENILTNFTEDKFFEVGNHTVFLKYWGDANYDESNTTVSFNITKAQSNSTVTFDDIGYDISMNVTIFDEWDDKFYGDANGTATVEFYIESDPTVIFRSVDVIIVDGVGYTVVHDLLPKNYTVKTTYHDDHNYNSSVNTTNYSLPQKDFAAVFVDVNAYDIMVNDTIYINVTIVPPDEKYNVPGNVTLYLDNKAYNLTLTMGAKNATATFNITNLTAGLKKVIAFYEGSKLLEPAMGEADFRVHKYNTTLSANVTNITIIQNEIINITLLNDTTGVVSAIVDGKEYFGRIKNGTVLIELPQLPVGKYNVTLFYEGDNKYHNATNYTLFYVIQAAPEIIIDVDNVTYGNETLIVVTLPEDATGNVTVKINDTYYVFDTQNLTDGKAILPGVVLPAGNYTVEVTYNGDENYTVTTNSTKFTVYKAKPVLNITVEDIYYGEKANITVTVPDGVTGNITIKINGTDKNITLPIVDGKVIWTVGGLAVGNYIIIANYSGNENYTNATVTSGVNVLQIGTVLDVDVHNIPIWDTEYINITIKDAAGNIITNATGNVTININGVDHTAEIKDGVARFNTSNLTIGHKVVWVFYDGDRNLTGSRSMAEFDVTQRTPKVNVTALNITVDQDGKITINIPKNATGHVVLSGNFTDNPISVYDFTDGVAEVTVKDLAVGNYSVHIKYYGDDLDNYTVAENDTTFSVAKINATVSIVADNVTYGNATTIVVTVPEGVTGNITLKLNDTTGRNITLPIEGGKVTWVVEGLAAGNYTVNATYNGNDDYNINNTESGEFEVKKIDPNLQIYPPSAVNGQKAEILIFINDRIDGEYVTITGIDKEYTKEIMNGVVSFTTDGPLDYTSYTMTVTYGGNQNFTDATKSVTFTPAKITDYEINVTGMNITVNEDEIITVTVPDGVTNVSIWVDGIKHTNDSFVNGEAKFNITGLKEGVYIVNATVNDDNYAAKVATGVFKVSKKYPTINITVINETGIYVGDTVKVIVTVPSDVTENVTIEINGIELTNSTVDGNATFYIPDITYGNKTIVATYPGDDKYFFNSTTANFTVNKRTPGIVVTTDGPIGVGDNITISVDVPANATGYVVVSVNGTNYTINITNGDYSVVVPDLGEGTWNVTATYVGDDQYLPNTNKTSFVVNKVESTIVIDVSSINYGEDANITVTVKPDATGYITIRINETRNITLPIADGKVNWIVEGLAADNYTVYANYSGNEKYNKNRTDKPFEVRQIAPSVEIISVISTADDNATVIVKVDSRVTENVNVTIVGIDKNYIASVGEDGYAVITTDKLDYGIYTVVASYPGDKNFTVDSDTYEFTTNATDDYLINITATDIKVGNNTNITVRVPGDATGNVIIELNGTNYTAVINEDGIAVLNNISTLKEGVYNVTAYFGNDKYVNKTVETRFVVSKVDVPIRVDIDDSIYVGDTVSINVTLESDATGNVTIEINGETYDPVSFVDGVARFEVPNVTYGNKTVAVTYSGNDKYVSNFTTANFTVNKRTPGIVVTTDGPIGVGDNITISVDVPANATGYVVVSVNGTNYTINITNGDYSVVVPDLGEGTWNVTATYVGDDQYLPNTNKTSFVVNKVESTIVIDVDSIDYGNKVNITVTVKPDATGYITIRINETRNITLPIAEGKVNWIVEGLAADNYTVYANYSGNDKYNENRTDKPFEVRQISPEIEIIEVISTADDNATIIVKVDPRVTENVTVTVEGKPYSKAVDEKGIALITTDKLDYGTYTVVATYPGDMNFTVDFDTYEFTTNATDDYLINITATDIKVGNNTNITVRVPGDATGNVIIELNGTNYTAVINEDGIAVLNNISTLKEGVYNVTAYFGNDKYVNKSVETRFEVSKVDTPISITVINDTSIYVGDTVKVIVTVPGDVTENVTIEINGKTFSNTTVDGNATFYVPNITYGNKTVVTAYVGDDKYRYNSTTANFTVNKRESYVNVNVTDGKVGGVAVVNVTVPANATGYVIVNVDGQDYAINLTDGVGSVEIRGLANGTYDVTATYLGDDQYLSSINDTQVVKVDKVTPNINITVSEDGIIANGSDVDITVKVPVDATGKVNITLSNGTSYIVPVIDGEAKLHLEAPDIGVYDITAEYLGDDKYTKQQNESSFEVYDNSREVIIIAPDTFVNVNNTVSVILIGAHEGEVTIIISNASGVIVKENATLSTASAEGVELSTASLTLPLLEAGKYNVSAYYIEHDGTKVILHEGNNNFTVSKLSSEIKIKEIRNITVGENATIELEIELDARANDGNISVIVDGKEYITNTTTLKVTVPNLGAGNYTVEAFYQGNRWYKESNATSSFEVTKNIAPISISVTNSNVGEVEQINVTLPENATGYVIVNVDGQEYHANVTNGLAQVNITGLKAGKHNVTAVYVETDGYFGNVTNTTFTVSKLNSTITVKVDNITVGDVAAVNITVITGASGNVTITIGDEYNKTVGVTDGVISVIVPDLTVGEKTVNVTYNGNEKYLPSSNSTDFTVGQTAAEINIVVENITYGEIESIIAFINATGNVTIKLDGDEIDTVDITEGKVVYDIEGLNAGNYTVELVYNGNVNTNSTSVEANFTVAKADPKITIEVEDIIYGDVEHIVVHVNAEGNVTIKVINVGEVTELTLENGRAVLMASRWAVPQYDGQASVDVKDLEVGNYPVEVTYNGNENYNAATLTADFDVLKANTTVSIEADSSLKVNETQVMNITINNTNATGNAIVILDGKNYTVPLTNGTANFTTPELGYGNHSVVVIYEGDKNLNGNWTLATFEVEKLKSELTINVSDINVGDKQTITVNVTDGATGFVVISVDGKDYYVPIEQGKAILELENLTNKTYSVHAKYLGDDYYDVSENDTEFNVNKVNSTVSVKVENITVGDKAVITITVPEDATGNVTTVIVNGETYVVPVANGTGILVVPDLEVGNYTVEVTYNGDGKYLPNNNVTTFEVSKVNTNSGDIKVVDQGNGTVVVVVGDNATGNVTIKVGNNTYNATVVNGTAVVALNNETPGTHDIEVIYSGDDTHEGADTTAVVNIPKYDTPINMTVKDIDVGDKATIVVSVPENATGNITIEIEGQNYTQPIVDGNATFEIENLTDGAKTVVAIYDGDYNYTNNFTTANFTVNKVTPVITVNATDVTVGDKTLIEVTAPDDITGPVLVDVDGVGYYVNITDGKGSIEVPITKEGAYNVTARYVGDDKYTNASANSTFKASKVTDTPINVTVENATVGDKAVITVDVPKDATGNVTITIDGKNYTVPVANGTATLVVDDLKAGNYTVDVTYNGDDKYAPANETAKLEISKKPVDLQVIDQGNGTITVVVGDNATGNVTVKVGNETYTAEVVNGTAVITLENNTPGTYDVEAIYSGDDAHEGSAANATATIPKLETPMSVTVENIKVGDKETIVVSLPSDAKGNVTIEINGVKYTEEIKDGNATFTIENLTYGNKTVYVDYVGDNNYTGNHTSANFTVEKRTPAVEVEVSPINVGETAEIKVTVPSNATGYVIVEIDNQTYAGEVKDGVATVKVKGLASGDVPINVTYLGDDQYDSANATSSVKVSKVPSTINVTADNITVGDKAVIKVEVPKDLCGNVTVTVDGKNYTVFVSGGEGTLVIPDLEAGNYTVDAIFDGCKKYEPSDATTKFTVSKKPTDIEVIDQNNGTVTVIVGDNATGNVTIKVGNETYNATVVNGTATITLENATPGTHDIEVIYSGDDTHEGTTVNSTVTIPKVETPISVDVDDIKVGETATIVVNVPEDATGNVTIEIDGVKYAEEIKDGKATFNIDNLTAGTKTIAVEYAGDDTYLGNHTTANITVSKVPSTVKVEIEDSNVGDNVTVKVTVPEDATGQVLIDIDGVGYYVNVTKGTGSVEIPRVPSGKYDVNVTYLGDDKYLPSSNKTSFNVDKLPSYVIPTAKDIAVGDTEKITFELPEDATGTLTVIIDGEEFTVDLDTLGAIDADGNKFTVAVSDGKAVLTINDLPKGEYTVEVRYNGDDKYLPSTNSTKFTVSKTSTDMEITDNGDGTVKVELPDDATGNVTIKVGNNTYTVPVVNGTAIVNLTNETPGKHDIEVIYSGDDKYGSQDKNSTVTIPKYDTPISVEVEDINVGDTAKITVNVPEDATGTVTIEINGKEYTAEIKDGKAVFEVPDLTAGDKTVAVKYAGDKNYVGNFTTGNFTVSKVPSTASATSKDIKVGKDEVITVTVPKDATGRVLVDINGVGYYADIVNGKAKVIVPELPSGKYTAKVTYEGDDKYLPSTTTTKFTVTKNAAPISASGDEIPQGKDATVVVKVPSDATGTVTITVDGKKYTAEVKDSKAVFVIPGLTKGDHGVTAVYSGDKKYDANDTITDIEVVYQDNPNNGGDHGEADVAHNGDGIDLSQHATGNPILVLLLIIIVIGSTQIRRFKK
nr:Ig-like domain repeat protein [Methanobrevibacter sp.]